MKKLFYILFVLPLLFIACVNNSDEPDPTPPPPPAPPVTVENLNGIWETFYSEKGVLNNQTGQSVGYRVMEYDGFVTTYFKEDTTFQEANAYGDIVIRGKFSISEDTVKFHYRTRFGNDTTTFQNISQIDAQFLKEYKDYVRVLGNSKYSVRDVRRFRNTATAAGLHPGVDKVAVTKEKMLGSWEMYDYYYYINNQIDRTISDQKRAKYKGTVYTFFANGTATAYTPSGKVDITGTIRIVDDVVYTFSQETDPKTGDRISFFTWVTEWKERTLSGTTTPVQTFVDFDQFRNKNNINQIIRTTAYFKKIN